jgi:8-oxo-dGTP pyrophosphatase MutT (NUDIX family)
MKVRNVGKRHLVFHSSRCKVVPAQEKKRQDSIVRSQAGSANRHRHATPKKQATHVRPAKIVNKVLQRYWRISRGLTLGVQGMVLDSAGRVLLVRHSYRPGWHFPGGGVEKGETVLDSLKRELAEETGVELTAPPDMYAIYTNFNYFPGDHILLFAVRHWKQTRVPKPNHEIIEQAFFAPGEVPQSINPPTMRRLREFLSKEPPDTAW